jgi:hypothetical protein
MQKQGKQLMRRQKMWINVEQNTPEWQSLRCGKVTASNAACFMANLGAAFGQPAKDYALQIALEQITGIKSEAGFSNEHTERGHEQEPIARMLYEQETFSTVTNGGFFDCGHYGTSPDGLVGQDGVVEIKSVIAKVHYATLRRGAIDPAYKWQVASHLDGTGRDWVDFVSYCSQFPNGGQLIVCRTFRKDSEADILALRARRDDFLKLVDECKTTILRSK